MFVSQAGDHDNVSTKLVQMSHLDPPQGQATHILIEPYAGLMITERTQRVLCTLLVSEVMPLLEPFTSKVAPDPGTIEEIVDKYNLFKIEVCARKVWQTPSLPRGRAVSADQRTMQTDLGS